MCGLVGLAGNLAFKDEATMRRLLLLDYFRGPDSTGFAAVRIAKDEVRIAKMASHPLDLFDSQRFKDALNGNTSKAFIGHNRAATRGVVNGYNAHPYEFDHIIGCHNGTLEYGAVTDLERELGEKFPVDSMALIAGISRMGIKDTMSLVRGAWSLVWYDGSDNTLNFLRNKERPMWFAHSKEFDKLIWASEWQTIHAAYNMGPGVADLYQEEGTGHRFWATDENQMYTFDLAALEKNKDSAFKPKATKIEGKAAVTYVHTYHHGNKTNNLAWNQQGGQKEGGSSGHDPFLRRKGTISGNSISKDITLVEPTILHTQGNAVQPLAGFITKDQFLDWAKYGCSFCSSNVYWGQHGITIYERDEAVLCPECSTGADKEQCRIYLPNSRSLNLPE